MFVIASSQDDNTLMSCTDCTTSSIYATGAMSCIEHIFIVYTSSLPVVISHDMHDESVDRGALVGLCGRTATPTYRNLLRF